MNFPWTCMDLHVYCLHITLTGKWRKNKNNSTTCTDETNSINNKELEHYSTHLIIKQTVCVPYGLNVYLGDTAIVTWRKICVCTATMRVQTLDLTRAHIIRVSPELYKWKYVKGQCSFSISIGCWETYYNTIKLYYYRYNNHSLSKTGTEKKEIVLTFLLSMNII